MDTIQEATANGLHKQIQQHYVSKAHKAGLLMELLMQQLDLDPKDIEIDFNKFAVAYLTTIQNGQTALENMAKLELDKEP